MSSRVSASQPATAVARASLPRAARLLKPADFKRVFKNNQATNDRLFRVLARANQAGRPRLGMAVSKKVDRTAVGRNRIKRVIRESFRHWVAEKSGGIGIDVVVLPRAAAASICNHHLFRSLKVHWSRIDTAAGGENRRSDTRTEEIEN